MCVFFVSSYDIWFDSNKKTKKTQSAADVVIAGLGWVSVTGAGPVTLRVWAPRGVLVMAREPLLPYESWETTAKFTGGATVKKGRKKQGRRA